MLLDKDAILEYSFETKELKLEDDDLEVEEKVIKARRDEIKARVKEIALIAGSKNERVIIPVPGFGAWDRIVSKKGEGLNVEKLEKILGTDKYRRLACVRTVTYVPSAEKIDAARLSGKITENQLKRAHSEGTPTYVLKKLTDKQLKKHLLD